MTDQFQPYQQPYQQYPTGAYAPPPGYGYPVVQPAPSNGIGTGGFVCGLLGVVLFWIPIVGVVLALLGVILGGVGIASGRKSGAGTGLAIAGLVLGIVALAPAFLIVVALASN